ncbi:hypothetical protein FACS1894211_13220 [Clostridia bacterium]|nr:hypothetical protein FACS1894211_13220 [Clostridia bacterium]
MEKNITQQKAIEFAVKIVRLCNNLRERSKEFTLSNQLLRSGTSIGSNYNEAQNAATKKDFINKVMIYQACDEIIRLLTSIAKTAKGADDDE